MPTENRSSNTELSKIVTDALVAMVSGITGMKPPADEPLPGFIQAPIDRAAERIAALLAQENGFSAGDMADQGAKAFRDGQRSITELTDDLREILGRPNFACHHIAQALRQMGHTIAKKSEDEQASVIHWMLGHYLKYGPDWRQQATDELRAVAQASE